MCEKKTEIFLSVIIPAFNEEKTIEKVIQKLQETLRTSSFQYEIIVIDDGSKDDTAKIVRKIVEIDSKIRLIQNERNLGKGKSVSIGIRKAIGKYIIVQDADMEYNPENIPNLLEPIINGEVNVVYGTRFTGWKKPEGMSFSHFIGNRFLSILTSILYFKKIKDMETGYKCFPRKMYLDLDIKATGFELEPEITSKILKKKNNIKEVSIDYKYREHGTAKITIKDGLKAAWILLKNRF